MDRFLLPKVHRPEFVNYKRVAPGLDFPCSFLDDLKAIDTNFYLVFHRAKILWDDVINEDAGPLDDPRYQIHVDHGHLNFGFVLKNHKDELVEDGTWHLWRLCRNYGWAHIVGLAAREGGYLNLLTRRLNLQGRYSDKYGARAYSRLLVAGDEANLEDRKKDQEDLFGAFQQENDWLLRKAKDNFESGIVKPTNPQVESVVSYAGQVNRSKTVRPMDDEDAKLIIPGS